VARYFPGLLLTTAVTIDSVPGTKDLDGVGFVTKTTIHLLFPQMVLRFCGSQGPHPRRGETMTRGDPTAVLDGANANSCMLSFANFTIFIEVLSLVLYLASCRYVRTTSLEAHLITILLWTIC